MLSHLDFTDSFKNKWVLNSVKCLFSVLDYNFPPLDCWILFTNILRVLQLVLIGTGQWFFCFCFVLIHILSDSGIKVIFTSKRNLESFLSFYMVLSSLE